MNWISGNISPYTMTDLNQLINPNSYHICINIENESIFKIGKKSGEELDKIVEEQWIQKRLVESLPTYVIVDKLPEEGDENKVYIVMEHNDFTTYIYKDGGFEEVLRNSYQDYEEKNDDYIVTSVGTDFPLPLDIL